MSWTHPRMDVPEYTPQITAQGLSGLGLQRPTSPPWVPASTGWRRSRVHGHRRNPMLSWVILHLLMLSVLVHQDLGFIRLYKAPWLFMWVPFGG